MTAGTKEHRPPDGSRLRRRGGRSRIVAALVVVLAAIAGLALLDRASGPSPAPSWNGDFDGGGFDQYERVQEAAPDRTATVDSPRRRPGFAARLTANDGDLQGGENPRAQLLSATHHRVGDDQYIGWSTYFPADFPAIEGPRAFFVFFQFHGPPFSGSPPLGFGVGPEGRLELQRSRRYGYDRVWSAPLPKGRWIDFVAHVRWSMEEDGFVELWLDGDRQTFSVGGRERLAMQTVEDDQLEGLQTIPTNYRRRGIVAGDVTIYHDEVKVGSSYAAVAP